LGVLVTVTGAGNLLGTVVGSRIKKRTRGNLLGRFDSVLGAAVSSIALFLATWFLALNLVSGPFPFVARGIQGSKVVGAINAIMPEPPSLIGELRTVLNTLGFPDVFVGLPPVPAPPVTDPTDAQAKAAEAAVSASTVEVLADGCYKGFYDQGSGFVVSPGYVITNAHVVGGSTRQWVHQGARDFAATVVAFDPALDVAILHVPDLHDKPVILAGTEAARGAVGAVLGFPGGGPLTGVKAAVRQVIDAVGRDIYGRGEVTRRMYEVQAQIRPGNSGGPFVLADGKVAGLVFASSVTSDQVGYAMVIGRLAPVIDQGVRQTAAVNTQSCAR
jgi:S1-C subfamily serine protease